VEKEELETARTPEIDRTAASGGRAQTRTADERSILALQRSAGNRAVGSLLAHAPRARGTGPVAPIQLPLQRKPDDPPEEEPWPEEPVSRPILWPEEAEGERNEPCFNPEFQARIGTGATWADAAAGDLTAMPPNFVGAVPTIEAALESWGSALGSDPGKTALNEAMATIGRARDRVSVLVEPVGAVLEQASVAAVTAAGDASAARTMMAKPASADEEPRPCFDDGQQAEIAEAVNLADAAGTELGRRPPSYRRALTMLTNAAAKLDALGGEEPGQARLKGAGVLLNRVADSVDAYLTPVEAVVAAAAADVRAASAQAREAAEMAKPVRRAAGAGTGTEPPEAGGQAPDVGQGPES